LEVGGQEDEAVRIHTVKGDLHHTDICLPAINGSMEQVRYIDAYDRMPPMQRVGQGPLVMDLDMVSLRVESRIELRSAERAARRSLG
jgi:hypothetical protein